MVDGAAPPKVAVQTDLDDDTWVVRFNPKVPIVSITNFTWSVYGPSETLLISNKVSCCYYLCIFLFILKKKFRKKFWVWTCP